MATDLGGEVGVETEPLEVNAKDLRKPYNTHLLETVLEALEGKWKYEVRVAMTSWQGSP